ncbi:TetR/AcrR family transcriptional regulator [Amycolatopsis anabasis]|uniref:TetR/AcrR family transcriptional regulator n=1 Tax=Amycolatopsis anabasis TaxID=1840409 RepID=UPI00131EA150|nr:TetR/AcrR family transcriptional regulator [Amycolatopsis anabasis]
MTAEPSAPPGRRGRGRPRDARADAAILRAALDLFLERGVEGTSIEQVAKRAGVGKLTVYRRWNSKEALLAQAIESARGDLPTAQDDLGGLSLTELISRTLSAQAEILAAPRFRALIAQIYGSSTRHPELMETYWEHHVRPRREAARALLERARAEGLLAEDTDLDVLMDMMVGAVTYRLIQPGTINAAHLRRYLEAVYRQLGLLPP